MSSTEKLDQKNDSETLPVTPTKQTKTKDGSPAKLQVSFDSSIMSSTDAADRLFESIEDETLPIMDDSSPENSESFGKDGKHAENMDDSINKDIEEIEDTEIVAGNLDVKENVDKSVLEKSKSPTPDVVPQVDEFNKDSEDVKPVPAITSTPAKEVLDLTSTKTNAPASASKSQKELELEEYRAKLAEKRRQAREKAEREAEIERQKQEQLRYLIGIIIIHNASLTEVFNRNYYHTQCIVN